jgi:hypothetical protein
MSQTMSRKLSLGKMYKDCNKSKNIHHLGDDTQLHMLYAMNE